MADFMETVERFVALKRQCKLLEVELAEAQDSLIQMMETPKFVKRIGDGTTVTLTIVAAERVTWLADKVKAVLTPAKWKLVKVEAVDKKKLEAFIAAGDLTVPDECKEVVLCKPYIRMTEVGAI